MTNNLIIDGSFGEGGGQILRSSLALSVLTRTPFTLTNIRAGRKSPGLKKQHLKCIEAALALSNGSAKGATFKSSTLEFMPGTARGGEFRIDIGSAGSTMLVLQTVLPIMLLLDEPSSVTVTGGTHNPWAPPFEFFHDSFVDQLHRMGAKVEVELKRYGFFPQGGGEVTLSVIPAPLSPITLDERGEQLKRSVKIINLKGVPSTETKQLQAIERHLSIDESERITRKPVGPGNAVVITQEFTNITAVSTGLLKRKRSPEIMAQVTAEKLKEYLEASYAVDQHLTDQLLLPMLLAGGGSFTCAKPTLHSTTNAEVIGLFTGLKPTFTEHASSWTCEVPDGFKREASDLTTH